MPPKNIKTEEHRRAQQRLCKRRKYLEIKNDPELLAIEQEKRRNKYQKRKEEGKIKSIKERPPRAQREQRKKWKENSKRYRQIKKQEEMVNPPFDLIEAAEDNIPESDKTEEQKKVEEQRDPLYQITPAMKNVMKRTRYNKFKKSENVHDTTENQSVDDMAQESVVSDPPETKPKVRRRKKAVKRRSTSESDAPPEEMEMPVFPLEIANEAENDSDRLFLLSFLPEMRQLPLNLKMWVRAQIAGVMQEAVTCHYSNTQPGNCQYSGTAGTSLRNGQDVKRPRYDSAES